MEPDACYGPRGLPCHAVGCVSMALVVTRRAQILGYAAAVLVLLLAQWALWTWAIEDAAISIAYARNIADGLGPVPYPGAPRTEGYSNPLWVALMVPFMWWLDGADPFPTVRTLGLVLSLAGVAATAAVARPSLGRRGAVVAAFTFAAFAPMNIWAQSGLENALYNLVLALGLWRLQVDGRRSWAAVCFLGLALTRPEAGALAAVGFVASVLTAPSRRQAAERAWDWALLALVPFVAYHLLRYSTFAAELPATAYAKVDTPPEVWNFGFKGWRYLRDFAVQGGFLLWLPAMFFALGGAGRDDAPVAPRVVAASASLLLAAGYLARLLGWAPDEWAVLACLATSVALTACGLAQGGIRATLTAVASFTLLFALLAGGDWMTGWRWFSLLAVPIAYGFAAAVEQVFHSLPRRWGPAVALLLLTGFAGQQLANVAWVEDHFSTSPWTIKRRVHHYQKLAHTLQLRRRPLVIDQDMGANLLWGAKHYDVRDAKGLTDLPFALHRPRSAAVDSLLVADAFEKPVFVHMHQATRRALQHRRWFRREYVEVPGYPTHDGGVHDGQYVQRKAIMGGPWHGERRSVRFDGLEVLGWQTRSPEVSSDSGLLLEIAVTLTEPADGPLDLVVTARGPRGAEQTWSRALGYHLLPADQWKVGEVFVGRYPLPVRKGLPEGSYTLSVAVQDEESFRAPIDPAHRPGLDSSDVVLGRGLQVVSREAMSQAAQDDLAILDERMGAQRCSEAESAWEDALAHRIRSRDWRRAHEPRARDILASCWAERAARKAAPPLQADLGSPDTLPPDDTRRLAKAAWEIQRGRTWSPTNKRLAATSHRVAEGLVARSAMFRQGGHEDDAFRILALAARVDPTRPFLRRRVERWRARRLGLEDRLGPLPPG